MINKNQALSKMIRRDERDSRVEFPRRYLADEGVAKSALTVLCDPKQKLTGAARRYLNHCRSCVVVMPPPVARPLAVKLAEKLASLKLTQVIRRRSQFAARAAGAKYKLEALSPNSMFGPALQRVQDANLFAFKQAQAELDARKLHATDQLSN